MKEIRLQVELDFDEVDLLKGEHAKSEDYDILLHSDEEVRVLRPDGSLLFHYTPNAIPPEIAVPAWEVLNKQKFLHGGRNNRGSASGKKKGKASIDYVKKSTGTLSNTTFTDTPALSGVLGYMGRNPRFPYCRPTVFLEKHPKDWATLIPLWQHGDRLFQAKAPERHAAQKEHAEKCCQFYIIPGTTFSTITANANYKTAYHYDGGDYEPGMGNIFCFRAGHYEGAYLVYPRYRVAIDMGSCSHISFDVGELHGNTPLVGKPGTYKRITTVMYLREEMIHCLTPEEELERAKNRKLGDPMHD